MTNDAVDGDVVVCALTETGDVREENEDSIHYSGLGDVESLPADGIVRSIRDDRGPLLVVCDGLGGMAGGGVASKLAVETLSSEMASTQPTDDRGTLARLLRRAVRRANRALIAKAERDPSLRGMGTTVSAAAMAGSTLVVAQVGDSRAYLARGEHLVQLTDDQSLVSAMLAAGTVTDAEAKLSVNRSVVLQALGGEEDVAVSLSFAELRRGDRVLVCSDGLHGVASAAAIRDGLGRRDLQVACRRLIALAHQAGAPDNVSVILAQFQGQDLEEASVTDPPPSFAELDRGGEGGEAASSTSLVARRLAVRAGLIDDDLSGEIPNTSIHPALESVPKSSLPMSLLPWGIAITLVLLAIFAVWWLF